jgi:cyanophycinase
MAIMSTRSRREEAFAPERRLPGQRGAVLAMSGAAEHLPDEAALRQFIQLAGGEEAVIAVISSAATNPVRTGEAYAVRFRQLGAREANWLHVWQRCDANSAEVVMALRRATGIFIADGDLSRLRRLLVDTRATETIRQCNDEGTVVAGISFGAAMLPPAGKPGGTRSRTGDAEALRISDLAELGIGAGLLADLGAEQYASHAVEWSDF